MVSLTPKMSGKICNNLEKCHEVNKSQNTSAICFKWVEANLFMYFSEDNIHITNGEYQKNKRSSFQLALHFGREIGRADREFRPIINVIAIRRT